MKAKEAVQAAKDHVLDLFEGEGVTAIGLEEIEVEGSYWKITIGFARPWDKSISTVLGGQGGRSYKVVRVSNKDGQILSVKDRVLTANTISGSY